MKRFGAIFLDQLIFVFIPMYLLVMFDKYVTEGLVNECADFLLTHQITKVSKTFVIFSEQPTIGRLTTLHTFTLYSS